MTAPEVSVVAAWHEALNRGDVKCLVELSHRDVEVGDPHGIGKGAQLLRKWVVRASIYLEPQRAFHKGNTVVVEQEAKWRSTETGELSGSERVASVFLVRDELVRRVTHYPDLAAALRANELRWLVRGTGRLPDGGVRVWQRGPGALNVGGLRIRRYEPGDRKVVWRLHNKALDRVGAHLGNGEWDDLHGIEGAYLEAGGEFLVGGVQDERVVAMGALRRISPEVTEIKRVRVEPALQGRGYGQDLVDAFHGRAAGLGYSTLRLATTVQQWVARSLYEGNGYRGARRGRIGPFDCVFYERSAVV